MFFSVSIILPCKQTLHWLRNQIPSQRDNSKASLIFEGDCKCENILNKLHDRPSKDQHVPYEGSNEVGAETQHTLISQEPPAYADPMAATMTTS